MNKLDNRSDWRTRVPKHVLEVRARQASRHIADILSFALSRHPHAGDSVLPCELGRSLDKLGVRLPHPPPLRKLSPASEFG